LKLVVVSKACSGPGWYWDVGRVACDVKVPRAMPVSISGADGRPFYASGAAGRLRDRLARE